MGRNSELIELRDRKIMERYHYWTEIRRLRFDDTIRLLSRDEFFLSEERIMTILRKTPYVDSVNPIKHKEPRLSKKQINTLFPEYN